MAIGTGLIILQIGIVPGVGEVKFGGPFAGIFLIFLGVIFLVAAIFGLLE